MDWANEKYVRLYVRDTPEWLILPWQAKALWPLLVRKLDRSGVLATKLGARGVAVLVGLPIEVVEAGLDALQEDGCLQKHELGYLAPNFIEAQETSQSDAARQRESRQRRRSVRNAELPVADVPSDTECHTASHAVRVSHSTSQPVTLDQTRLDQTSLVLSSGPSDLKPKRGPRRRPNIPIPEDWQPRTIERDKATSLRLDCDREAQGFRNHHLAKGTLYANWDYAFCKWLDKAVEILADRGVRPGGGAVGNGGVRSHVRPM